MPSQAPTSQEINARLRRALTRERAARREAEDLSETHLREIWASRREAQLLSDIAQIANGAVRLSDALAASLRVLGEYLGSDVGHALLVRDIDLPLESSGVWWERVAGSSGALRVATATVAWSRGVGLPGRAWDTGSPVWIEDLVSADAAQYPRHDAWRTLSLRSAVALPVFAGDEVVAVLELFAHVPRHAPPGWADQMRAVGTQLGRIVERSRDTRTIERRAARRTAEIMAARDATKPGARQELDLVAVGSDTLGRHLRGEECGLTNDQAADLADDLAALVGEQSLGLDPRGPAASDLATAMARAAMSGGQRMDIRRPAAATSVAAADRVAAAVVRLHQRTVELRDPGEVATLTLTTEPGAVRVEVSGLGLGASPALRHRVALALVRAAVRTAHGRVESTVSPGPVRLWLPDLASLESPRAPVAPVRRTTVLLAVAGETQRLIGRSVLEGLGAQVETARTADEVRDVLANEGVDLVLLDDALPGGGFAVASEVRALIASSGRPMPRVVGLVARATTVVQQRAAAAGMHRVVEQPLARQAAGELLELDVRPTP